MKNEFEEEFAKRGWHAQGRLLLAFKQTGLHSDEDKLEFMRETDRKAAERQAKVRSWVNYLNPFNRSV